MKIVMVKVELEPVTVMQEGGFPFQIIIIGFASSQHRFKLC